MALILFGLIGTWVFGREYADRTVLALLALPTPRYVMVSAKLLVVLLWSVALTVIVYLIGLGVGFAVQLPPASPAVFLEGTATLAITACLTIALVTPIVFFASVGRGYLPPMAVALFHANAGANYCSDRMGRILPLVSTGVVFRYGRTAIRADGSNKLCARDSGQSGWRSGYLRLVDIGRSKVLTSDAQHRTLHRMRSMLRYQLLMPDVRSRGELVIPTEIHV